MFRIDKYRTQKGSCPFDEFISDLSHGVNQRDVARVHATIERLAELGSEGLVQIRLAEKMNDVWQLRPLKKAELMRRDYLNEVTYERQRPG